MRDGSMPIKALAPWFGANRQRAQMVGNALGRVAWCAVPFMGGASELPWIETAAGVASDRHLHIINLARVIRDPALKSQLADRLDRTLFHERELRDAQAWCREREQERAGGLFASGRDPHVAFAPGEGDDAPDLDWAFFYFIACWMGPGAKAGKSSHLEAYFPVRFSSSGGCSAKRFRSAVESLDAWCAALCNWTFIVADASDIIARLEAKNADRAAQLADGGKLDPWGCYCDPPWPEAGREYEHRVDDTTFHEGLAERLRALTTIRVVVRYGDHPLIRRLYDGWETIEHKSRTQANSACPELLLTNAQRATE